MSVHSVERVPCFEKQDYIQAYLIGSFYAVLCSETAVLDHKTDLRQALVSVLVLYFWYCSWSYSFCIVLGLNDFEHVDDDKNGMRNLNTLSKHYGNS